MSERAIFLVDHRHYDVVWRKTLEDYADMQERHLLKVVEMMRNYPQYKFTISQAISLANFLMRHYELESELRVRLREGRIAVAGGAYATPDTNMISGEALYRNFLYGVEYFRKFDHVVKTGSLEGASGYSAQLPQILRQLGFTSVIAPPAVPGLRLENNGDTSAAPSSPAPGPSAAQSPPPAPSPSMGRGGSSVGRGVASAERGPSAFWWEGLDGTRIPAYTPTLDVGPTRFYPEPFQETFRTKESYELLQIYRQIISEAQSHGDDAVWLHVWDEERKVDDEFVEAVWQERRRKDGKPMRFADPAEYAKAIADKSITAVHRGEINPLHTGVYTTRIGVKQASVMLENLLVEVEKWFAAAGTEVLHFPELKFRDLWEQVFVLQSHHAITGCHTDKVRHRLDSLVLHTQRDLHELRTRAIHTLCAYINAPPRMDWRPLHVFNSLNWQRRGVVEFRKPGGVQIADNDGNPVPVLNRGDFCYFPADVPACGYNTYWFLVGGGQQPHEVQQNEFATDCFKVSVQPDGRFTVTDKRTGTVITRPGEQWGDIIAREDRGSLWCKAYTGAEVSSTITGTQIFRALLGWELRRTGEITAAPWQEFGSLTWTQAFFFYDKLPYFDLHVDLAWKGSGTELRLRMPLDEFAQSSVHGIPYGAVARFPYAADYAVQDGKSLVAGGDWPACAWVEFGDGEYGITIAHTGTPGIQCEDGVMQVSLLRSPIDDPEYSHNFYLAADRGAHDNGNHHYRFSFMPAAGDWRSNGSYRFGFETQNPLLPYIGPARTGRSPLVRSFLDFGPANLICTAWLANRQGRKLIRIYEAEGRETELVWGRVPERRIYHATPSGERLDLVEKIVFKPFEIKNIMLA